VLVDESRRLTSRALATDRRGAPGRELPVLSETAPGRSPNWGRPTSTLTKPMSKASRNPASARNGETQDSIEEVWWTAQWSGSWRGGAPRPTTKGRRLCPSCWARRVHEVATQFVELVFPEVPIRQYVLSPPAELVGVLAARADALVLARVFVEVIFRGKQARLGAKPKSGAVAFVRRLTKTLSIYPPSAQLPHASSNFAPVAQATTLAFLRHRRLARSEPRQTVSALLALLNAAVPHPALCRTHASLRRGTCGSGPNW
jgi:hypothetical protein